MIGIKRGNYIFYSQVDIGAYELPQSSDIEDGVLPLVTSLSQNYPNPFNPATEINYQLAAMSNVKLVVFNANGELLKTLVNDSQSAGDTVLVSMVQDLIQGFTFTSWKQMVRLSSNEC